MERKLFFCDSMGNKICGILSNPTGDKEKPIVILCHGFSSSKNSSTNIKLEKILKGKEISTFRIDFYGHGESDGLFEDITLSKAVDDVLRSISFLKNLGYNKIGLMGSSFGGIASILAASKSKDLFVLALKAPVSDYLGKIIAQISKYPVEEWEEKGFIYYTNSKGEKFKLNYSFYEDAKNVRGYEAAGNIKVPTIIVHGDSDESVPIEQSRKTAGLIPNCKLKIIKGANHLFSKLEDSEKMLKLITDFIVENS